MCFLITGGGLSHNHGFSFYGGRWATIVPWAVGFIAASVLILQAASAAAATDAALAGCLRVNVVLLLLVAVTPDTVDQVFYVAHVTASVLLFLFQAGVGLWLVLRTQARGVLQLYVVQIAGGIVAGLSQAQWIGLLSPGILAFQVAFGALLVVSTLEPRGALETA